MSRPGTNPKTIRRECQCCGRGILANTGVIAHHGYQRPGYGYQIGTCMGARFAPFEASRERLGALIGIIERELADHQKHAAEIEAESIPLPFEYLKRARLDMEGVAHFVETTRGTFNDVREAYKIEMLRRSIYSFDDLKTCVADKIARCIKNTEGELAQQRARFNGWKQLEQWTGDRWEALQVKESA